MHTKRLMTVISSSFGGFARGEKVESEKLENPELESDMVFAGLVGLEDPPRPEVPDAIRKCHEAGIKVIMITGDASRTAVAIAKEIGLVKGNPVVIEGNEFIRMSDKELRGKTFRERGYICTDDAQAQDEGCISITGRRRGCSCDR